MPGHAATTEILVLGDVVGYGADPNAVVERVRSLQPMALVRGNHDKVSCGLESADGFNVVARAAAQWTTEALTDENMAMGGGAAARAHDRGRGHRDLPRVARGRGRVHLRSVRSAGRPCSRRIRSICLFGHTHYPAIFRIAERNPRGTPVSRRRWSRELTLIPGMKYLINPGSVGQPRDGDPQGGVRHRRRARGRRSSWCGWCIRCRSRRTRSAGPACRSRWRTGWRQDDEWEPVGDEMRDLREAV